MQTWKLHQLHANAPYMNIPAHFNIYNLSWANFREFLIQNRFRQKTEKNTEILTQINVVLLGQIKKPAYYLLICAECGTFFPYECCWLFSQFTFFSNSIFLPRTNPGFYQIDVAANLRAPSDSLAITAMYLISAFDKKKQKKSKTIVDSPNAASGCASQV